MTPSPSKPHALRWSSHISILGDLSERVVRTPLWGQVPHSEVNPPRWGARNLGKYGLIRPPLTGTSEQACQGLFYPVRCPMIVLGLGLLLRRLSPKQGRYTFWRAKLSSLSERRWRLKSRGQELASRRGQGPREPSFRFFTRRVASENLRGEGT